MSARDSAGTAPLSILVVDDRGADRLAIQAVLEPLGHRIVLAESAESALANTEQEEFALILTDVCMPRLDGFDMLAELRRRGVAARTPVVFLSAHGNDSHHAQRAYELGALDYIVKPITPAILRAKVRAHVGYFVQTRELRQQNEALGILGHDLRNPLAVIALGIQALLQSGEVSDRQRKTLVRLSRSAERMRAMIGEILDFTRLKLGEIPLSPSATDLGRLCDELVDEFSSVHPGREIKFLSSGDLQGRWDRARLAQALSNLLSNALQHGDGVVALSAQATGDALEITVENRGEPIPPEILRSVFEPFHRQGPRSNGLGLGLYIVREIVRAHGGSIVVRSSASDGTAFRIRLPRTAIARQPLGHSRPQPDMRTASGASHSPTETSTHEERGEVRQVFEVGAQPGVNVDRLRSGDPPDPSTPRNENSTGRRAHQPQRVMVLEDEKEIRDALAEVLSDVGCEVTTFADGGKALAYLQSGAPLPSIIFLDLMMPGMDGYEFRAEQKKNPALASIPVVVVSAADNPRDVDAARILRKPVRLESLIEALEVSTGHNSPPRMPGAIGLESP